MSAFTNAGRRMRITTPTLGADAVVLKSMRGTEGLSQLFTFSLDCLSTKDDLNPADIVGKNVTINVLNPNEEPRFFNGYVSRFAHRGRTDRASLYSMEVVPWLWFLTRKANCRIFQRKSIPEIVVQIFDDLGFKDVEIADIKGTHPKWEYCVQYRETDFNFISRLLEQEGIFYYFRHEEGKHTLVLADSKRAYKDCVENEVELSSTANLAEHYDTLTSWEHAYSFPSGRFAQTDYNFEAPTAPMQTKATSAVTLDNIKPFEIFEYPGDYKKKEDGQTDATIRMEELDAAYNVVKAAGRCRTFTPGGKFKVTHHATAAEEGKRFVITAIEHVARNDSFVSGEDKIEFDYNNSFTCIPDTVTFRPPRNTSKPVVHGLQSAIVTGPAGDDDIYTDKYGRVKVQFYWDREGKLNDDSSCFLRVATTWAGKNWGGVYLPRIGMEVLVSFLEGDPDRPLVTGAVYNANNMPPYELPANKTQATIKSLSTTGGDGFNEFRFEDKKGSEHVFLHAEKDLEIRAKNDRHENIDKERHLTVGTDKFEHIKNNRNETVDNDHIEEVKNDRNLKVGGKQAVEVTGSKSLKVGGDVAEVFQANHSEQTTGDYYLKADNIVIEGMTNVTIKVGQSYIAIESGGIKLGTTGTFDIDATGATTIKSAASVEVKGPQITVSADSMLTLKGGQTLIN